MIRLIVSFFISFISLAAAAAELKIIVPFIDGGYTTTARIVANHMGKYLPDNPTITIQAMPGAASLVATNYLYNIAPKDGSVIAIVYKEIPFVGLLGGEGVQFDPKQFNWIGSVSDGRKDAVILWANEPKFRSDFVVGAEGATSGNMALFVNNMLGTNFKIVNGYPNTSANRLALERKEVDAVIYALVGIKTLKSNWLQPGSGIYPTLQMGNGATRLEEYKDVPTLADYVTSDKDKKLLRDFESQFIMSRPFVAPPGVQKSRIDELRDAFEKTMNDGKFIEDAKKLNIDMSIITGAEMEYLVKAPVDTETLNSLKQIYKVK
jgi:tripartite-type tricarboxylate transporter receptor subunit TctC